MTKTYKIAVVPGDGTGPEVVAEGVKILNALASKCNFRLDFSEHNIGGEQYLASGKPD